MDYKQILQENGWQFFENCMCGGSLQEKYNNPDKVSWTIIIRPYRNIFIIKEGERSVSSGFLKEFEQALKAI